MAAPEGSPGRGGGAGPAVGQPWTPLLLDQPAVVGGGDVDHQRPGDQSHTTAPHPHPKGGAAVSYFVEEEGKGGLIARLGTSIRIINRQ